MEKSKLVPKQTIEGKFEEENGKSFLVAGIRRYSGAKVFANWGWGWIEATLENTRWGWRFFVKGWQYPIRLRHEELVRIHC